jgi:hypothetical protein
MSTLTTEKQTSIMATFLRGSRPLVALSCLILLTLTTAPVWGGEVTVVLKADSGKYAARCNGCIPGEAYPDNVAVHVTDPSKAYAQWKLHKLDNGNYTLQSVDSGKYAARCNGCIPKEAYPDSVFVHVKDPNKAYAQWRIKRLANGKYSLQSVDSGKYAARCNNCAPNAAYPDNVFVHVKDVKNSPWAQWEIIIIP